MKSVIERAWRVLIRCAGAAALTTAPVSTHADVRVETLRKAASRHGVHAELPTPAPARPALVALGRRLFDERKLSLNGNMACQLCHLDSFSSADGLPNAIGVGGVGTGVARAASDGRIVPRNTLPLWGRGGPGFNVFFWDGKVAATDDRVISQFGDHAPATDPLVVAVHLPFVEFGEMLREGTAADPTIKQESVAAADRIYATLTARIATDASYVREFRAVFGVGPADISFDLIAEAIAAFIRDRFALTETRFSRFLAGRADLTDAEIAGGLVFFGKGRCAGCHNGPYFSDFAFHAVPFPQLGFGKNGFGVDYGRFNVTHDPDDLYRFRTPPLINVVQTFPYGHSGSLYRLADAIRVHFDPLAVAEIHSMDDFARHEFYKRLLISAQEIALINYLDNGDIDRLIAFLDTLTLIERFRGPDSHATKPAQDF